MKYKIVGHSFDDIRRGVLPMNRRKMIEFIDGDMEHAKDVFRANNPGFQIMTILPWGVDR